MNQTATTISDRVDRHVHDLIRQHQSAAATFRGTTDIDVRRDIYFALLNPQLGLVESVVRRHHVVQRTHSTVAAEELRLYLCGRLERLVLGGAYDLQQGRNASAVGWARKMLAAHAQRWRPTRGATLDPDVDVEVEARANASERELAEIEELEEALRGTRGILREQVGARGIQRVLGLPDIAAPASRRGRDDLLSVCRDDPQAIIDALRDYREVRVEVGFATPDVLEGAQGLFADWSIDHAERMLAADPDLTLTFVRAALSPRPRPAASRIAKVRWLVRALSNEPHWVRLAIRLVDAWVDEHCAAVNDWDGKTDFDEAEEQRAERAKDWVTLARQVVEWPGNPLDAITVAQVGTRMAAMFDEVET